jgi:hypothetical protein
MKAEKEKLPLSHKPKSETRQKQRRITFRLTPDEYASIEENATATGVSLGTHIRDCVLKAPQTGRRRRPHVDVAALSRIHAQVRHIGGNLNQIAKSVNVGEMRETAALPATLSQVQAVLVQVRQAMGFAE